MKQLTGREFDLMPLMNRIIEKIMSFYGFLKNGNFELVDNLFHETMYRFGEEHRYKSGNTMFSGKIIGVNEIGQLLIVDENRTLRQFHFKEVEFIL